MKYSAAAVLALATAASAFSNVTYTTEVVTALTTYCPASTTLTHNGKTYTITEATTLTITDCPCTVSKPVYTSTPVVVPTNTVTPSVASVTPVVKNATSTYTPPKSSGTGAVTPTASTPVTAGAGKIAAFSGAGLAGALAIAALL